MRSLVDAGCVFVETEHKGALDASSLATPSRFESDCSVGGLASPPQLRGFQMQLSAETP